MKMTNKKCNLKPSHTINKLPEDIYTTYSKFEKNLNKIEKLSEIEEKFPFIFKNDREKEKYINQLQTIRTLQTEIREKRFKPRNTLNGRCNWLENFYSSIKRKTTYYLGEDHENPEIIDNPLRKLLKLVDGLEKYKSTFDFLEIRNYHFNASLIYKNLLSKGCLLLGSNNYKHKLKNLKEFDVVVNVIGEYPNQTFQNEVFIEEFHEVFTKEVNEYSLIMKDGHVVYFYVKPNENFNSYHYLADVIHAHVFKGKRVLVHCQMGQIRSATLVLFYLRKYFFTNIEQANEFIGLKRENAGAPQMLLKNIEQIIKNKKEKIENI